MNLDNSSCDINTKETLEFQIKKMVDKIVQDDQNEDSTLSHSLDDDAYSNDMLCDDNTQRKSDLQENLFQRINEAFLKKDDVLMKLLFSPMSISSNNKTFNKTQNSIKHQININNDNKIINNLEKNDKRNFDNFHIIN